MENNPGRFWGYAFVDLFGFALEAEVRLRQESMNLILLMTISTFR